jgi:predicted amidohydrolase YtcJ
LFEKITFASYFRHWTSLLGSAGLWVGVALAQIQPADTVILNGRIYTENSRQPWAEALAVRADKVVAAGKAEDINVYRGSKTKVIDAGGRLVLPGFTDSHIHFLEGSMNAQQIVIEDTQTLAGVQRQVKAYAAAHPEKPWILGRGWAYPMFGAAALPDKKYLDEVIPDRPVYLECFDGHTWWANSKALQLAGITRDKPDPVSGIMRDPNTGEPTGVIKEDPADAVVERVIPLPTRDEKLKAIRQNLKEANRAGLVRVHSASNLGAGISDLENIDLYDELRRAGDLSLRMYMAYYMQPPTLTPQKLLEIENARRRYHDEWIAAGAAKFFLDGVIESHTAAMLAPYSDDPSTSGQLLWDPDEYTKAVIELDRHNIQVFTHAIGDRAIRLALDAYEAAQKTNRTEDARHRIEHIEDASAADIPRFGKLGVIASFQPLHAYPNDDALTIWARNVGPERAQRAWAWRSIENSGGRLAFGSDWPVVTFNPWTGVQTALTRQTTEGNPPGGFVPQERMTLEDVIRAYTLGGAFAGHRENTEGSLEPGKLADLIVLSQDLFKIPPDAIGKTEVLLTMVGGKVVYQSPVWQASSTQREAK